MPTQVQRRPSEPLVVPPYGGPASPDHLATVKAQQQQHREALRLALGSILTPKRPPMTHNSRSSSGSASPLPSPFALPGSGAHTPIGTPPPTSSSSPYFMGHGPISSEHLHPHHPYSYHGHHLPPSRLGRSNSNSNSPLESLQNTAPSSAHPSPRPGTDAGENPAMGLPTLPDIEHMEPLPPAVLSQQQHENKIENGVSKPVRPSIMPLHPSKDGSQEMVLAVTVDGVDSHDSTSQSGRATPRVKFLQTLQSKSAWDALIHGSFS